jgi:hypothetical protein
MVQPAAFFIWVKWSPGEPVTADLDMPAPVKQILRTSCYNCHSNETKLSWFDQIVPAYWLVVSDVKQARSNLNFSELATLPKVQQRDVQVRINNILSQRALVMP